MTLNAAPPLRMMGGVHRGVLTGEYSEIAAAWPSPRHPLGDIDAAHAAIFRLCQKPSESLLDSMARDPQTNEVGRAAALAVALSLVVAQTELPIQLLEIGASAGLNLRIDQFACRAGDWRWGPSDASLHFGEHAYLGMPPAGLAGVVGRTDVIIERRGCDIHPIDSTSDDGALTLTSYIWPDQFERLTRLDAAIAVARDLPAVVDQASADDWLDARAHPSRGCATVVMHSVMWQYMPDDVQARASAVLRERGERATSSAPFFEVALEPTPNALELRLSITSWPGGRRRELASCGGHGPPVTIL